MSNMAESLDTISPNVMYLELGDGFNRPVDGLLPSKLISIKFGISFSQSVNNLPKKLKSIIFGNKFNQSIDNLPDSLRYLEIHSRYKDRLPQKLVGLVKNKKLVIHYLSSHSSTCESSLILPEVTTDGKSLARAKKYTKF